MSFRVCIPTAGTGSRLGDLTKFVNKSLVSIANRPTLSHLIEQFPQDAEFVLALGHKGNLVREFLELAYPNRKFYFADVDPFEGPGSGLGLSLLACKEFLQQPFIFISCDTLVKESIPEPNENWMAYAALEELSPYRTLALQNDNVSDICEKGVGKFGAHQPYIGLAGIKDYKKFWTAMEEGGSVAIQTGEAHGLRALLPIKVKAFAFTWYDTGNQKALSIAREIYREPGAPNILEKANEAIWFIDNQVIKFSDDQKFIANRVRRVEELRGFVPNITDSRKNMYRYPKIEGKVMSEAVNLPLFDNLLAHCKKFWSKKELHSNFKREFLSKCKSFYCDKTFERIALFYKNFAKQDGNETINGISMPKLEALLNNIDWDWLADGLPGRFHGDFHFENILWNANDKQFTFLDWRQDFAGDLSTGDIYYDFAKLLHGLIICHELISKNMYSVEWGVKDITFDFHRKQILVECENRFNKWLEIEGYDRKKVRVLTSLIYLNIAALHHHPYSLLLFVLGKTMLKSELEN